MSDTNYTDYLKTCSTWRANHSNKSSEMLQDYEEKFKIRELNRQIDEKNDEIYKLRYDLDDTLKIKEDLIFDLESVERELDYVKNKARETEDALLTKIRILEIEKKHFEERYLLRDQSKYLNTSPRNFYKTDRTETKTEENKFTDICLNFVNKFQNILLKEKDRKYFNNYNTNELELREKLILIENELLNILTKKNLEKLEIEKKEKNVSSSQVFTHKLKELSEENEKLSHKIQELYSMAGEEKREIKKDSKRSSPKTKEEEIKPQPKQETSQVKSTPVKSPEEEIPKQKKLFHQHNPQCVKHSKPIAKQEFSKPKTK